MLHHLDHLDHTTHDDESLWGTALNAFHLRKESCQGCSWKMFNSAIQKYEIQCKLLRD